MIVEEDGGELRHGCQVMAYDHLMDAFVDLERHVADIGRLYPRLDTPTVPLQGDLLAVDERPEEMEVSTAGDARELLARVARGRGQPAGHGPARAETRLALSRLRSSSNPQVNEAFTRSDKMGCCAHQYF